MTAAKIGHAPSKLLVFVAFVLSLATGASAEDTDWKKGKLARLVPYIGTYKYEKVWNDPDVKPALTRLLGDKLPLLERNIQVRTPIDFMAGYLVLSGNKPGEANRDYAIVVVQIYDGEVMAGIFSDGKHTIYTRKSDSYVHVPSPIWEWVYYDQINALTKRPPTRNFEWIERYAHRLDAQASE